VLMQADNDPAHFDTDTDTDDDTVVDVGLGV
jgi:hypothetical protein